MSNKPKRNKLLLLLALSLMLAACSSGKSKKSCGGETCKIGKNEGFSLVNRTGEGAFRE